MLNSERLVFRGNRPFRSGVNSSLLVAGGRVRADHGSAVLGEERPRLGVEQHQTWELLTMAKPSRGSNSPVLAVRRKGGVQGSGFRV